MSWEDYAHKKYPGKTRNGILRNIQTRVSRSGERLAQWIEVQAIISPLLRDNQQNVQLAPACPLVMQVHAD